MPLPLPANVIDFAYFDADKFNTVTRGYAIVGSAPFTPATANRSAGNPSFRPVIGFLARWGKNRAAFPIGQGWGWNQVPLD